MAQIPEHVKKAMTEFAGRLTELEKAVAEFTKVTLEHREKVLIYLLPETRQSLSF